MHMCSMIQLWCADAGGPVDVSRDMTHSSLYGRKVAGLILIRIAFFLGGLVVSF